jgi:oligoribonuclease
MKYVSIDIETTGLDVKKHQIISFAAIIEDTNNKLPFDELPKFKCIIKRHELIGSIRALMMNVKIIGYLDRYHSFKTVSEQKEFEKETGYLFLDEELLAQEFYRFLASNKFLNRNKEDLSDIQHINFSGSTSPIIINVAGKNFGTFDKPFLEQLPWWNKIIIVRQRILDPGILYLDWQNDESIPSLNTCKERAGIDGEVTHDAMDDAWDVINLLRFTY